jgi:hypothetical protein
MESSHGSTHKALKGLKYHANCIKMAYELMLQGAGKFFDFICNNMSIWDQTFLTDEAWFHLNGYINSLNTCIWATENSLNSLTFNEAPLHTEKISVWCAVLCSLWDPRFFFFNPL